MQNMFFLTTIHVSVLPLNDTEIGVLKSSSFWKTTTSNTDFWKLSLCGVSKAPDTALVA